MRLLVCGGRTYSNHAAVKAEIEALHPELIIHGAARGADTLANFVGTELEIPVLRFAADWLHEGRTASMIRSKRMLDLGKPDMVLAFPGGKGTASMVRMARAAGIPVKEIR